MRLFSLTRNLFIFLLSFSSLVSAGQFDNPYQGNIAAVEQSESELKAQALAQVLVKVSGNAEIAELAESKQLFKKAESLLSQYGYRTVANTRYFTAVFDKGKINQALQAMQQPVWGDTRPTTLVWLITDGDAGRQLYSDNMASRVNTRIASAFQQQQYNRGISLQFPLMDLEDNLALSVTDVSGRFYKAVAAASKRYGVEHFVAANLRQIGTNKWSLFWELVKVDPLSRHNRVLVADKVSGGKSSLIAMMVSDIADYYASQYAILENQGEKFSQTIYINDINSLAQLTELNQLLSKLFSISSFEISSVQGSQVTVNVKINGGLDSFRNGLSAQPNLQPDLSQSEAFHFNWR